MLITDFSRSFFTFRIDRNSQGVFAGEATRGGNQLGSLGSHLGLQFIDLFASRHCVDLL
jgi:hypothetical protein